MNQGNRTKRKRRVPPDSSVRSECDYHENELPPLHAISSLMRTEYRLVKESRFAMGSLVQSESERHAVDLQMLRTDASSLTKVYRFFKDSSHADALAAGNVWISTLEEFRRYEDPLQGDPHEAIHEYYSGHAVGHGTDADLQLIACYSGIEIEPGTTHVMISNNKTVRRVADAFALCATEHFDPDMLSDTFGQYCVEITNPLKFFQLLTSELSKKHSVDEDLFGRVIYRERKHVGLQKSPGVIGFVKPLKYQSQRGRLGC
jgi:hypothetical protein